MQYALIAGGSKGIGLAIAEALARRGYNLLLIARHAETLQQAKQSLEKRFHVSVAILSVDLSLHESADLISNYCAAQKFPISILCNVAGIGGTNDYLSIPLEEVRYMIHLNIESMSALTLLMLHVLEGNKPAYILNVASLAGFAPIPVKNMYSATKSAVISFSRALRVQLKSRNISVSCLCPGPVFTKPEIEKETIEKMGWFGRQMAVSPERVGEIAVRNTLNKKFVIVPGFFAKLISFFVRLLPDKLLVFIYDSMVEKPK